MKRLYRLFTVGSLLALASAAHAAPACTPVPWDPVWTVKELPQGVQAALRGANGMADAGGSFNATDVGDSSLPMRRMIVGVIGADCVHVSVERGGRAPSRYRQAFQRDGSHWILVGEDDLAPPSKEYADWVRKMAAPPLSFH
jgi:hypothetical protein